MCKRIRQIKSEGKKDDEFKIIKYNTETIEAMEEAKRMSHALDTKRYSNFLEAVKDLEISL